ncbi:MAG: segregation/condensation protein A [Leptolinea sp.]|jgi:segregation and condensation protein A|nr:segregation/condensation protein A [Leptolinea sp.]
MLPDTPGLSGYRVNTPVYEGPLDLLLSLIEKAELDITRLALAQVTDQYLTYIQNMEGIRAADISEFLVIAAKLIQIKSAALLPRPPAIEPEEEDPGEALARQLILYKKFKEASRFLIEREEKGWRTYLHIAQIPRIEPRLDLSGVTLTDLLEAAREILSGKSNIALNQVVAAPRVTIRERITRILTLLRVNERASFFELVRDNSSRLSVVVTFLAMLELVKRHVIEAEQTGLFSDIVLQPLELSIDEESVSEFGE